MRRAQKIPSTAPSWRETRVPEQLPSLYAWSIVETLSTPLVLLRPDLRVHAVNRAYYRDFHATPHQIEGRLFYELDQGRWNRQDLRQRLADVLTQHAVTGRVRVAHEIPGRGLRMLELTVQLLRQPPELPERLLVTIEDVTQRDRAEQRSLSSQRLERRTFTSLKEKEVLLKEIHHRMKNNLQAVSSLLSLQADFIKDRLLRRSIKQTQCRIRSMALVHEILYSSPTLHDIDMAVYLRSLTGQITQAYTTASVQLLLDLEPVVVGVDAAIPCGLIVNELVSNALKHAFPRGRRGIVRISLHQSGGRCAITIQDNGVGLPPRIEIHQARSLGLQLIDALITQLDGTIETDRRRGTAFTVTFPNVPSLTKL